MTSSDALLAGVAAHGLPGRADTWPDEPLEERVWSGLLARARRERLTGFLAAALDDEFPATSAQAAEAEEAHQAALRGCLHLERFLLDVTDELLANEVRLRLLKGPALARWAYADPAVRTFGDIDLLIASEDWDRALRVLAASGLRGSYGEPRPGWASRFAKGDVLRADAGQELDLHRTFVGGPLGLSLDLGAVFADPRIIEVGGRMLPVLAPDPALLHACYNAALADLPPRLVAVRDVAQILTTAPVDVERVLDLARASRAEAVVARAILVTEEALSVDLPLSGWAHRHRRSAWERATLLAYTDPRRNTPRETVLALLAVPGVRAKAAYVGPLLFPQRSFLGERHATRAARMAYAVRRLRGRSRRGVRRGRRAGR